MMKSQPVQYHGILAMILAAHLVSAYFSPDEIAVQGSSEMDMMLKSSANGEAVRSNGCPYYGRRALWKRKAREDPNSILHHSFRFKVSIMALGRTCARPSALQAGKQ